MGMENGAAGKGVVGGCARFERRRCFPPAPVEERAGEAPLARSPPRAGPALSSVLTAQLLGQLRAHRGVQPMFVTYISGTEMGARKHRPGRTQ